MRRSVQCIVEKWRPPPLMWPGDGSYPREGEVVSVGVHVTLDPICNQSLGALHTDLKVYEGDCWENEDPVDSVIESTVDDVRQQTMNNIKCQQMSY